MFERKTISVVLPVYNEGDNVREFIESLENLRIVDEIIAVDNNSTDSSKTEIESTSAIYLMENVQGYGAALTTGLRRSSGDLVIMIEPDGTFGAIDILKLLEYSREYEVVFGTRTNSALIYDGANMPQWIRLGNWLCAKYLEVLFNGPSLTDVGCTLKLFSRQALQQVLLDIKVKGSHFSPEIMALTLMKKLKCVEIPVSYKQRVGTSKITGLNARKTFVLGIRMFLLITKMRVAKLPNLMRKN